MKASRFRLLAFGMTGALLMASVAYGQTNRGNVGTAVREAQAPVLPEFSGDHSAGVVTAAYGSTGGDLVYTPVTPCRIINTLLAGGPIAAGSTRSFWVTGSGFAGQGGVVGSCGVPIGATGAVINFVAVNPTGAGDLRYTPYGVAMPLASFLNYVNSGIPNDNTANGMTFPVCNSCAFDFTIQADASATHVVADVLGYFKALPAAGHAWASVQRSSGLETARTKNFTAVSNPLVGVYCLTPAAGLNVTTVTPLVTIEWGSSSGFDLLAYPLSGVFDCPVGTVEVRTYRLPGGVATLSNSVAFFVWVP